MTQNHDDTDAMLNEMMARGREAQNSGVRTRDEQIEALTSQFGEEGTFSYIDDWDAATRHILEAEARGAAEQRRKDAEGQKPIVWAHRNHIEDVPYASRNKPFVVSTEDIYSPDVSVPLYTHPANVAALEAMVKELEGVLGKIEYASRKDSLSETERLESVRAIARTALKREGDPA